MRSAASPPRRAHFPTQASPLQFVLQTKTCVHFELSANPLKAEARNAIVQINPSTLGFYAFPIEVLHRMDPLCHPRVLASSLTVAPHPQHARSLAVVVALSSQLHGRLGGAVPRAHGMPPLGSYSTISVRGASAARLARRRYSSCACPLAVVGFRKFRGRTSNLWHECPWNRLLRCAISIRFLKARDSGPHTQTVHGPVSGKDKVTSCSLADYALRALPMAGARFASPPASMRGSGKSHRCRPNRARQP